MHNRIMERIPAEWGKIVVGNHPNRLRGTNMRDLCDRLALHKVHDHLR
jgi:hypothetical protein